MRLHGQIKQKRKSISLIFLLNRSSGSQKEMQRGQKQSRDTVFDIQRMKSFLKFHLNTLISGGVKDNCIYCNLNPLFLSVNRDRTRREMPLTLLRYSRWRKKKLFSVRCQYIIYYIYDKPFQPEEQLLMLQIKLIANMGKRVLSWQRTCRRLLKYQSTLYFIE